MTPIDLAKWMASHKPVVVKERYTVIDLARSTGYSRQHIHMMLKGERAVTAAFITKLQELEK